MMEMHTARDARLGLETRDIPRDEIAAPHWFFWTVNDLAERKDRRQDRRRGMTAEGIADIVEIERVRRGAVDQRGVERRRPPVAAEDQAFAARLPKTEHPGGDAGAGFGGAGQSDADRVEDRRLGPAHRFRGQSLVTDTADALGNAIDDRHLYILPRVRRRSRNFADRGAV